jgi:hypothetical protein
MRNEAVSLKIECLSLQTSGGSRFFTWVIDPKKGGSIRGACQLCKLWLATPTRDGHSDTAFIIILS